MHTIHYLSHGKPVTGGDRHELFFVNALKNQCHQSIVTIKNRPEYCTSFVQYMHLLWWGFRNANADLNIVVARLGLGTILRNIFNNNKVIIVLHQHYPSATLSFFTKILTDAMFGYLRIFKPKNVALVVISDYWKVYFEKLTQKSVEIHVFPNLMDGEIYKKYHNLPKKRQIYLGQYGDKNNYAQINLLCAEMQKHGIDCIFSTLFDTDLGNDTPHYKVIKVPYETYLETMAQSIATIKFIVIPEAWNRVAHESILVNTPVIGFDMGGLGDLLRQSGSVIVENYTEAVAYIINEKPLPEANRNFAPKYDVAQTPAYIAPIVAWSFGR